MYGDGIRGEFPTCQLRFFPPGLPPGRLPPGPFPPGLGPPVRPAAGFRSPPVLPLKPGPDFENPPGLAPKAVFARPPEAGLPAPPGFGFHPGFLVEGPERLLLGRAPPARGLPVLVVKGRERSPSARGGRPAPNSRAPVRRGPPLGRALLGRSKEGRSKRGRSGLGRSEPAPRNGGLPVVERPVGRLRVARIGDSRPGSTASIWSRGGLGGLRPSLASAASRRGPAWGFNGGRLEPGFCHGFFSKGRPPSGRRLPANLPVGRPSRGGADPNCAGGCSERGKRSPNRAGGRAVRSSFFHAGRPAPNCRGPERGGPDCCGPDRCGPGRGGPGRGEPKRTGPVPARSGLDRNPSPSGRAGREGRSLPNCLCGGNSRRGGNAGRSAAGGAASGRGARGLIVGNCASIALRRRISFGFGLRSLPSAALRRSESSSASNSRILPGSMSSTRGP